MEPISRRLASSALIAAALAFGLTPPPAAAQSADLTGPWNCDDGGTYYLRQLGNDVWWYGERTPVQTPWSNVAAGSFDANGILRLTWVDVPKGGATSGGYLLLRVDSLNRMVVVDKSGGFGGSVWTR